MNQAVILSIAQQDTEVANSGSLALIVILFLIFLLIQKELSSVLSGRYKKLSRALNIAIVPLFITFLLIVVLRLAGMLQ